jgi:ADP-heptose:LPS heptosyltransferase
MSVLQELPDGARILVLRLRSLGDCVLTTPALAILRAARPDAHLGIAVESRFTGIFEGNPDVDEILEPSPAAAARFRAHLCINFHGGTRSMVLTAASRAPRRAGFAHHAGASLYNLRIPRAQEIFGEERPVHTAEHLASAIFWLGAPRLDIPRARLFARDPHPPGRYAVIHPLASAPDKTWPADGFLSVAAHLAYAGGLEPVFLSGPGEDCSAFSAYRRAAGASLAEVKNLLAGASLFLGNDSGPAHMAAAFGIPSVVLFGASDSVTWAPWKTVSETLVNQESIASISCGQVIAAVERLRVRA